MVFLSAAGSLLFLIFVIFIASMVALFLKRRQQQALQIEQLKLAAERMIAKSQIEIQEQTFKNISQEIHDNIGQMLSLAKLQIHALEDEIGEKRTRDTTTILANALQDLRSLSKSLHPDRIASLPLRQSIRQELELLERTGKLKTIFRASEDGPPLSAQQRIVVFRIFQEVISNAIRHSDARQLQVDWTNDHEKLTLVMEDDGVGFLATQNPAGLGMTNMQQRAAFIGASLKIDSIPDHGTRVCLTLPHTDVTLP